MKVFHWSSWPWWKSVALPLWSLLDCLPTICLQTSVLCKSAIHAGAVSDSLGGRVAVSRGRSLTLYESTFANGILSKTCVLPSYFLLKKREMEPRSSVNVCPLTFDLPSVDRGSLSEKKLLFSKGQSPRCGIYFLPLLQHIFCCSNVL